MTREITITFSAPAQGGKTTVMLEMAKHLLCQGFDVRLGSSYDNNFAVKDIFAQLPKVIGWPHVYRGRHRVDLEPMVVWLEEERV